MTDNVILFPNQKKKTPEQNMEEIEKAVGMIKTDKIEMLTLDITDLILAELSENGFDIDLISEDSLKDLGLVMESAKSLVCRNYGEKHFLHKFTDNIFDVENETIFLNTSNTITIIKGEPELGPT